MGKVVIYEKKRNERQQQGPVRAAVAPILQRLPPGEGHHHQGGTPENEYPHCEQKGTGHPVPQSLKLAAFGSFRALTSLRYKCNI